MTAEQFSALIAEAKSIRIALEGAAALFVLFMIFIAVCTYFALRRTVDRDLEENFKDDAQTLFEKNKLDELMSRCRSQLAERPNHAYARWYLGRALLLKGQWAEALEQLDALRTLVPHWTNSIETFAKDARSKMERNG
jgi:hypothetical protein